MTYKTYWLSGLLAPMLVSTAAVAVPANIAANGIHTAFIDNGAVFSMGMNKYGEVAPATAFEHRSPYFTGALKAKSVAVNYYRTAVLKTDGTITINGIEWVYKQPHSRTLSVTNATDVALTMKDTFYVANGVLYREIDGQAPYAIEGGTNVKYVAAGDSHIVILFNDGTVGTFGNNWYGQIGNGTIGTAFEAFTIQKLDLTNIVEIAAGEYTSAARNAAGEIFVFGKNDRGYLGLGTMTNQTTPAKVPGVIGAKKVVINRATAQYIKSDGTLWAAGWHNYIEGALYNVNTTFVQMPIGTVLDVAVGGDYTMVNRGTVGKIEGWGGNGNGKLGDGSILEKHQLSSAFFTPIPLPPEPVAVVEPVVEPVAEAPAVAEEVVDTAIANPLAPTPTPVVEPAPVQSTTDIIIDIVVDVVDVIDAVVDAVVAVVDAVVEVIAPTPEPIPAPEPVVVAPAPVVTTEKCNNGWGNGDQCAPGNSGSKNNAENNTSGKSDPTAKPKK